MDDKLLNMIRDRFDLVDKRFDTVDNRLEKIEDVNVSQNKMMNNLKVTVAGVSSTVSILVAYFKTKFFGG